MATLFTMTTLFTPRDYVILTALATLTILTALATLAVALWWATSSKVDNTGGDKGGDKGRQGRRRTVNKDDGDSDKGEPQGDDKGGDKGRRRRRMVNKDDDKGEPQGDDKGGDKGYRLVAWRQGRRTVDTDGEDHGKGNANLRMEGTFMNKFEFCDHLATRWHIDESSALTEFNDMMKEKDITQSVDEKGYTTLCICKQYGYPSSAPSRKGGKNKEKCLHKNITRRGTNQFCKMETCTNPDCQKVLLKQYL